MIKKEKLTVIMPALNEEKNITLAIDNVLVALKEYDIQGEIIVVNDGSTDSTPLLVKKSMAENPEIIKMVSHAKPEGMGASFWDGVDNAQGDFVVMIPGDNENDPREILRYFNLSENVDIIVPFIFNKEIRPFFRRILSSFFCFVINITFWTKFNYTNGTIIYRRALLKELNYHSRGFFFQTDILIRLAKMGYLFAEVPSGLNSRKEGVSKIFTFSSLAKIVKDYSRLVIDCYFKGEGNKRCQFLPGSSTIKRRSSFPGPRAKKEKIILDGHKLNWHKERVEAWLKGERIAPITIDCAMTRRCNYRCLYCYGQLQANDEKRMTRDVIFRFLDDAAEIGVKAVSFVSDGESTCSPHLYDAIIRGKSNGLDMALGTNGSLLKEDKLEEILLCLTYLRFNISAADPVRYAQIMGCREEYFYKVHNIIKEAVKIKKKKNLPVTIGIQMVLMPQFVDQIIPFAKLGKELGVDYAVIKHCSDDERGSLGIDYSQYFKLVDKLKEAEALSDESYLVKAKWSKILSGGKRKYSQCYGPPFIMQMSGSGLVAPCGMLFNNKYKKYHIGNIVDTPFKEIWKSKRYWEVMDLISSEKFDARKMCGTLCLQHKVNEFLWDLKKGKTKREEPEGEPPLHINFI